MNTPTIEISGGIPASLVKQIYSGTTALEQIGKVANCNHAFLGDSCLHCGVRIEF